MNPWSPQRIAWKRRGVAGHYVGRVETEVDGVHLSGRDPATGVTVDLFVPAEEILHVRMGATENEVLVGEDAIVLELAGSEPICLREIGVGPLHAEELATRLRAVGEHRGGSFATGRS